MAKMSLLTLSAESCIQIGIGDDSSKLWGEEPRIVLPGVATELATLNMSH